jgi:hypothetical protein
MATPAGKKAASATDVAGNFATFTYYCMRPLSRDPVAGIEVWNATRAGVCCRFAADSAKLARMAHSDRTGPARKLPGSGFGDAIRAGVLL